MDFFLTRALCVTAEATRFSYLNQILVFFREKRRRIGGVAILRPLRASGIPLACQKLFRARLDARASVTGRSYPNDSLALSSVRHCPEPPWSIARRSTPPPTCSPTCATCLRRQPRRGPATGSPASPQAAPR